MTSISLLYVTAASQDQAIAIGRHLVEERLAACVNVIPGMRSFYWWEGAIEESDEAVLIVKCMKEAAEAVMQRVRQLHTYQVPCILELPIERGNPAYLEWLAKESRA